MKIVRFALLVVLFLQVISPSAAYADSGPGCSFNPDGSITCSTQGGGGSGGSDGSSTQPPTACTSGGTHQEIVASTYNSPGSGQCSLWQRTVADCTGEVLFASFIGYGPCSQTPAADNPCTKFVVGAGGITCGTGDGWYVEATVRFPEIYLDVRPYPATLVRWPTALRNGGLPDSSGSGGIPYIALGGGSNGNPREGDWKNLRLTLTLKPTGIMFVTLPHIGSLALPNQGATGTPTIIQWEVPSHPAVGGGPLAGTISGLDELPGDIPLFVGNGRAPYQLFWELSYYQYEAVKNCMAGPNANGVYNCGGGTGHKEITGYEWKRHSNGGEIPPSAVKNLPASLMADINGDGTPDAYWDNNLTLRRMDDNNRVDNPRYQRSWNWGGIIYWAVREGQGQIGWPGQ